jgi:hypothetical protein
VIATAGLTAAIPADAALPPVDTQARLDAPGRPTPAPFNRPGLAGASFPAAEVRAAHLATLANEFAAIARAQDRFRRSEADRSWRPTPQFC